MLKIIVVIAQLIKITILIEASIYISNVTLRILNKSSVGTSYGRT